VRLINKYIEFHSVQSDTLTGKERRAYGITDALNPLIALKYRSLFSEMQRGGDPIAVAG
jgi:hypothetical protein